MRRLLRLITGNRWRVVRMGFPHAEGYGTYHKKRRTILDTGLTKEQAKAECRELNERNA